MGARSSRPSFGTSMMESGCLWVSDQHRVGCFHCETPFNFKNRRHHCRVCGELFCDTKKQMSNRDGSDGGKKATCWGNTVVLTSNLFPPELADAIEEELAAQFAKTSGKGSRSTKGNSARSKQSGGHQSNNTAGDVDSAYSGEDSNNMFLRERYEDPKRRDSSSAGALLGKDGKKVTPMHLLELAELLTKPQRVCAVCFFMMRTPLLRPLALNVRSLMSDRDPHNIFVVRVVLHGVTHKRPNGRHDHFVSLEAMAAAERNEADLEELVYTMMTDQKRARIQKDKKNKLLHTSTSKSVSDSNATAVEYGSEEAQPLPSLNQNPEIRDLAAAMNFMVKLLRVEGESSEGNTENGNLISTTSAEGSPIATDPNHALSGRENGVTAPFISVDAPQPASNSALVAAAGPSAPGSNSALFTADPSSPMITDEERTTFFANGLLLLGAKYPEVASVPQVQAGRSYLSSLEHTATVTAVVNNLDTKNSTASNPVAFNKNAPAAGSSPAANNGQQSHIGSYQPIGSYGGSLPFGGRPLLSLNTTAASALGASKGGSSSTDYNDLSKQQGGTTTNPFDDGSNAPFPQRVFGGSGYYEISLEQWRPFNKQTRLVFRTPDAAEASDRPHNFGTVGVETHHTVKLRKVHASPKAAAIAEKVDVYEMNIVAEEKAKRKPKVVAKSDMTPSQANATAADKSNDQEQSTSPASPKRRHSAPQLARIATINEGGGEDMTKDDVTSHPDSSGGNSPRQELHNKHRLSSPTSAKEKADLRAALHNNAVDDEEDEEDETKKPITQDTTKIEATVIVPVIALGSPADDLAKPLLSADTNSVPPANTTQPSTQEVAQSTAVKPATTTSTVNSFGSSSGGNPSAPTSARVRSNSHMTRARSEWDDFLPTNLIDEQEEKKKAAAESEVDYSTTKVDLVVRKRTNTIHGNNQSSSDLYANNTSISARSEGVAAALSQGNLLKKDNRSTMGNFAAQVARIDAEQQKIYKEKHNSLVVTPPMGPADNKDTSSGKRPSALHDDTAMVTSPPNYYNNLLLHNSFSNENNKTPRLNGSTNKGPHKRSGSTLRLSPSPAMFTAFNPQARSGALTPAEATGVGGEVGSVYAYTQSNFGASEKNLNAQVTKSQFRDGTVSISNFNHDYDGNNEAKVSALKKKTRRGKRQMDLNLNIDEKQLEVTMPAAWSLGCSSIVGVDVVEGEAIGGELYTRAVGEAEGERLVELQARAARESEASGTSTTQRQPSSLRFSTVPQVAGAASGQSPYNIRNGAHPKTSIRNPSHVASAHHHSITLTNNPIANSYLSQPLVVPLGVSGQKYLRIETFQEIFYFSIGNSQFDMERNIAPRNSASPIIAARPVSKVVSCIRNPCVATAIETKATPSTPGFQQQRAVLDRISNANELCTAVKRTVDVSHVRGRVRVSSVKILKAGDENGPTLVAGNGPYANH